jgi:hypothetical protein
VLLAFAVSFWGLHYKLSLYHPPAVHARGPAAKLLSQKERPSVGAQVEQAHAAGKPLAAGGHPTVAHAFAAWVLVTLTGRLPGHQIPREAQEDRHRLPLAPTRPSSPRAPPITA